MEALGKSIQFLKGVGPKRSQLLNKLGIATVFDLLWYIPRSYYDRSRIQPINGLVEGDNCSVTGTVAASSLKRSRRGISIFQAILQDHSGFVNAVWFNQPFLSRSIKKGQNVWVRGRVKLACNQLQLQVQEYDLLDGDSPKHMVMPVYALTEGLSQHFLRQLTEAVLSEYLTIYPDILNSDLASRHGLINIQQAFWDIHFPASPEAYKQARRRLACEELLLFGLGLKKLKSTQKIYCGVVHREQDDLVGKVKGQLPFRLTPAQLRVCGEIFDDMESSRPMNRLLQGDVGAGKTAVAALAIAKAISSGYQAAFMAPTEILAMQHFNNMSRYFAGLNCNIALLTGSAGSARRQQVVAAVKSGQVQLLVGTHALIQAEVQFAALGLAIVDEQHRFGVRQRALLGDKGAKPDILVMTATPIPRTLALTVYGDLDLSVIEALPPGRTPVKTVCLPRERRREAYKIMRQYLSDGAQCYVVCPLIEESEKQDLLAAETLYEELCAGLAGSFRVGLLHGRMKGAEKESIMASFKQGWIQVLVSTTVIEVGVDVPNASLMIIEQAERFGLSQLHQLRGRVGRGSRQSACFLLADPKSPGAVMRMQLMARINDGFKLAQADLALRGAGDFWGVRQHGLNQLQVADLSRDLDIVEMSQQLADAMAAFEPLHQQYFDMKFKKTPHIAAN